MAQMFKQSDFGLAFFLGTSSQMWKPVEFNDFLIVSDFSLKKISVFRLQLHFLLSKHQLQNINKPKYESLIFRSFHLVGDWLELKAPVPPFD